jgi:hypothetical protein
MEVRRRWAAEERLRVSTTQDAEAENDFRFYRDG